MTIKDLKCSSDYIIQVIDYMGLVKKEDYKYLEKSPIRSIEIDNKNINIYMYDKD